MRNNFEEILCRYIDLNDTESLIDHSDPVELSMYVQRSIGNYIVKSGSEANYKQAFEDLLAVQNLSGVSAGIPIGTPTVKEYINILQKFPEDLLVTNCGGDNYIYPFMDKKYITVDNVDSLEI